MLRLQNILYSQRLWTPVRYYDSYGSFRNTEQLPVNVPVSVAQDQSKPLVAPEEQVKENTEPKPLQRSFFVKEDYLVSSSEQDAVFLVEKDIKPLIESGSSKAIGERVELSLANDAPMEPTPESTSENAFKQEVYIQKATECLIEEPAEDFVITTESLEQDKEILLLEENEAVQEEDNIEKASLSDIIIPNPTIKLPEQEKAQEYSVFTQKYTEDHLSEPAVLENDLMTTTSIHENLSNQSTHSVLDSIDTPSLKIETSSTNTDMNGEEVEMPSSSSGASTASSVSSMAPVTPPSIELPLEMNFKSSTRSSLFRRETKKLNSKRKHFTMKLKSVLKQSNKKQPASA
ncbi:hypothetical protein BY458DRAFT_560436 [Sporodiniella umbellata]|nr:hypothetical protein BY458DRAFT_560436 [Sporodiniella umbellata]